FEQAKIRHPIEEIARLTAFHLSLLDSVLGQHILQRGLLAMDPTTFPDTLEYFGVRRGSRRLDARSVAHPPQECLIGEIVFVKVGGKDYELLEGYLDLFTGVQREIIDPPLKWNDPAIQEVLRRHALPAKVIDYQRTAVRF